MCVCQWLFLKIFWNVCSFVPIHPSACAYLYQKFWIIFSDSSQSFLTIHKIDILELDVIMYVNTLILEMKLKNQNKASLLQIFLIRKLCKPDNMPPEIFFSTVCLSLDKMSAVLLSLRTLFNTRDVNKSSCFLFERFLFSASSIIHIFKYIFYYISARVLHLTK